MSKGSPRITIRVSEQLLKQMERELQRQLDNDGFAWSDISGLVVEAIREYLAKRARSRKPRASRTRTRATVWPNEIVSIAQRPEED